MHKNGLGGGSNGQYWDAANNKYCRTIFYSKFTGFITLGVDHCPRGREGREPQQGQDEARSQICAREVFSNLVI